ncbi:MAG: TRAP transporter small permease [Rhodocyclaceae bacterium]|nr:MAG: TRAP transporter small permease [Rhodocyclaceae bacterium]
MNNTSSPHGGKTQPRWVRWYLGTVEWTAILATAVLLIVAVTQVFFRFVLDNSLSWTEELMRYLMAWTAFIGCGVAYSRGEMLGMRFIIDAAPKPVRTVVDITSRLAIIGFLSVTAWYGAQFALRTADDQAIALEISMVWIHSAVAVGSLLLAFHVLFHRLFHVATQPEGHAQLQEPSL